MAKATPGPAAATMIPPRAGPTARAALKDTEFRATASGTISRGTRSGTIAIHTGELKAEPTPRIRPKISSRGGVMASARAKPVMPSTEASMVNWVASSTLRRLARSARAPEGSDRNSRGSVVEAAMADTHTGDPVNSSISQAADTDWKKPAHVAEDRGDPEGPETRQRERARQRSGHGPRAYSGPAGRSPPARRYQSGLGCR